MLFFLSSVGLVAKGNLGEDDKPQLHQGWLTENLLEFATHHGNSGLGTCSCQVPIVTFAADIAEPVSMNLQRGRTKKTGRTPQCPAQQRRQCGGHSPGSCSPRSSHHWHSCSPGVGGKLQPAQAASIVTHLWVSGETGVILEELETSCYMHDNVFIRSKGNKLLHFVRLQVTKTSSYG